MSMAIRLSRRPDSEAEDDLSQDPAYEPPEPLKAIKGGYTDLGTP